MVVSVGVGSAPVVVVVSIVVGVVVSFASVLILTNKLECALTFGVCDGVEVLEVAEVPSEGEPLDLCEMGDVPATKQILETAENLS